MLNYKKKINYLLWVMLVINVLITVAGGCIFGLSVGIRSILRITSPNYFFMMQSFCNLMAATGIIQMIVASFDIFAAIWMLLKPLYLAIAVAGLSMVLQMATVSTLLYTESKSNDMVTENILRPWYVWECLNGGSCQQRMSFYVKYFMVPQTVLTAISLILHCLAIVYLLKLIRTIRQKKLEIKKASHRNSAEEDAVVDKGLESLLLQLNNNEEVLDGEEVREEMSENSRYPSTPQSILKQDHGYVAAPGHSLDKDYDDPTVLRHRVKSPGLQTLTFSTDVEIHVFNPNDRASAEVILTTNM